MLFKRTLFFSGWSISTTNKTSENDYNEKKFILIYFFIEA